MSFEEEQHFSPALLNALTVLLGAPVLIIMFVMGFESEEGKKAAFATFAFAFLFLAFFYTLTLKTQVASEGIRIKFIYIFSRLIRFEDIASAEEVQYRPIRDYGGWGVRFSGKGTAYNMRGNRGVKLKLDNGRRILIGSQRSGELATAINSGRELR